MCKCLKTIKTLHSFIYDVKALKKSLLNVVNTHLRRTFQNCLECSLISTLGINNREVIEIDSIIDYLHDEINTGHWTEISLMLRQAFAIGCFIKTIILLKKSQYNVELLYTCLKCLDIGLLLGAPLETNFNLLCDSASFLSKEISNLTEFNRIEETHDSNVHEKIYNYHQIEGIEINSVSVPPLSSFYEFYFIPQEPVKLLDCMTHWPALTKWLDVNYFLNLAGDRTVPVEIGSHYTDENWSQKLMTIKDFIRNYFLNDDTEIGYLAQHNLFDQITELRRDIYIPEYCYLSKDFEAISNPDINAWFGPKGTVSPLHYDPKNNILTQIFGTKQLLLFAPTDSPGLYPHESNLLSNTAQVNPVKPDLIKFPKFKNTKMYKCLLKPGEMLFIPANWWHHVTALEKSFSISFWWM